MWLYIKNPLLGEQIKPPTINTVLHYLVVHNLPFRNNVLTKDD